MVGRSGRTWLQLPMLWIQVLLVLGGMRANRHLLSSYWSDICTPYMHAYMVSWNTATWGLMAATRVTASKTAEFIFIA